MLHYFQIVFLFFLFIYYSKRFNYKKIPNLVVKINTVAKHFAARVLANRKRAMKRE